MSGVRRRAVSIYDSAVRAVGAYFHHRFEGDVSPLGYSWGIGIAWHIGLWVIAVGAIAQRAADPLCWTLLAGLLVVSPTLAFLTTGRILAGIPLATTALLATAVFIWTHPVPFDLAPLLPGFALGGIAVQLSVLATVFIAASYSAVLIGAHFMGRVDGVAMYLILIVLALLIQHMLTTQQRLLVVEQQARNSVREHAASEERRRIAREIHDAVAHSLSITLLHLTGARRGLQQDVDIREVVDALLDAERIGRTAVTDIRRTIGLLGTRPTSATAEPGIDDIAELVHDFEAAGLVLSYRITGNTAHVSPSTGLAIYRICQESLVNVVKHAPPAKADVVLDISPTSIALSISNDCPSQPANTIRDGYGGAGLPGMRQRAELLGGTLVAGRQQSRWTVHAQIPLFTYEAVSPSE